MGFHKILIFSFLLASLSNAAPAKIGGFKSVPISTSSTPMMIPSSAAANQARFRQVTEGHKPVHSFTSKPRIKTQPLKSFFN